MVTRTTKRKVRLSITVDPELKKLAEKIAGETKSTPSGVISQCLEELAKQRKEQAMIRYYQEEDKEFDEFYNKSAKAIGKIVASWSDQDG
jgi:predicted transcriptional regulator